MNLINLKCSNCNANLELDLDNIQAYCPYCGQKLLFDTDQIGSIITEKEKTKRTIERTKQQKQEYDYKIQKDKNDVKSVVMIWAFIFLAIILMFGFLALLGVK